MNNLCTNCQAEQGLAIMMCGLVIINIERPGSGVALSVSDVISNVTFLAPRAPPQATGTHDFHHC